MLTTNIQGARQTTLAAETIMEGVGVHRGAKAQIRLRPAEPGRGVIFHRVDLGPNAIIPARWDKVADTALCTTIAENGASVSTIEHLMAALAGCGVDNALIEIDGPEIPIMDGSAAPFVEAIGAVGVIEVDAPLQAIRILSPVVVEHDGKRAALSPSPRFGVDFEIDFDQAAIGRQQRSGLMAGGAFALDICFARTFGRLCDVEKLRAMGLALGGSLDNAVVVDGGRVLNKGGLRYADEFVRHKILDAVGDLALAGAPILGWHQGVKSGHDMTNRLLRALFAAPEAWSLEPVADRAACLPMGGAEHWAAAARACA